MRDRKEVPQAARDKRRTGGLRFGPFRPNLGHFGQKGPPTAAAPPARYREAAPFPPGMEDLRNFGRELFHSL